MIGIDRKRLEKALSGYVPTEQDEVWAAARAVLDSPEAEAIQRVVERRGPRRTWWVEVPGPGRYALVSLDGEDNK
jgi:hypothetical protein